MTKGIPVVDLTATVESLFAEAEECREMARALRKKAIWLDELALVLSGNQ